jgi:Rrf2 family nitric oxide-sensitive transcriptional repressor
LEVTRDGTKVGFGELQRLVSGAHVAPFVGNRAAKNGAEKLLFFGVLLVHVHVIEEVVHALICEDFGVEEVDGGVDGCLPANTVVKGIGCRGFFLAGLAASSRNHLAKVARELTHRGWIESKRGRGGGLNILPETAELTVGTVVRTLEPLAVVECHREAGNTCPIEPACKLKGVLHEATAAFLAVLDGYTIASLARRPDLLRSLLLET